MGGFCFEIEKPLTLHKEQALDAVSVDKVKRKHIRLVCPKLSAPIRKGAFSFAGKNLFSSAIKRCRQNDSSTNCFHSIVFFFAFVNCFLPSFYKFFPKNRIKMRREFFLFSGGIFKRKETGKKAWAYLGQKRRIKKALFE